MILWRKGRRVIECDVCDDEFEGEPGEEFEDFVARARRGGWKARKIGGEWVNGCPRHEV